MTEYRVPDGKIIQCPRCGKHVKTRVPKNGDGTAVQLVWHKDWNSKPCEGRFETLDYFGNPA